MAPVLTLSKPMVARVTRHATLATALAQSGLARASAPAVFVGRVAERALSSRALDRLLPAIAEERRREHSQVGVVTLELQHYLEKLPLTRSWEGDVVYTRTLTLATLALEAREREICQALSIEGYYPASVNEGFSYLKALGQGLTLFHFATSFRDLRYYEYRVQTSASGGVHFEPYSALRVHPKGTLLVAVKEPEAPKP